MLNNNNMVSVIVPVYNSERYIVNTIKSVISQTYKNIEIIVIDDCSIDNTKEKILESFPDVPIKYIYQNRNKGAAEARNRGLKESNGRYVAFIDSDDLWETCKIEKQIRCLIDNNAGFCYTSYDLINEFGIKIKDKCEIKKLTKYKDLLTKTLISTPSVMIDRQIVGNKKFPLRRTGQDYAFWLLLLRNNDAIGMCDCLTHVRKRKGSLSKNKLQNIIDIWQVQTKNENISKPKAFCNVLLYCVYILRKKIL